MRGQYIYTYIYAIGIQLLAASADGDDGVVIGGVEVSATTGDLDLLAAVTDDVAVLPVLRERGRRGGGDPEMLPAVRSGSPCPGRPPPGSPRCRGQSRGWCRRPGNMVKRPVAITVPYLPVVDGLTDYLVCVLGNGGS